MPLNLTIRCPGEYHIEGNPLVGHTRVAGRIDGERRVLEFRAPGGSRTTTIVDRRHAGD